MKKKKKIKFITIYLFVSNFYLILLILLFIILLKQNKTYINKTN